uniref:ATP synthase subunit gamma, mitochondrial n=1 Tax=Alexandrium catenella TaxID=2925 RepID=A0A7S1WHG1_ALECA
MFARRVLVGGQAAGPLLAGRVLGAEAGIQVQTRQAQSMKVVKQRMRSVENIKKITKAMKMVAAAKLKGDHRRMENGLPFVMPVQRLFERLPREDKAGPVTFFAVTSDKGLCGGVNSAVAKVARRGIVEEEAKGNTAKFMCIGNKGAGTLKRLFADRFTLTFEEAVKLPWSYATASLVAERLITTNPSRLKVVSNKYISLVNYETLAAHTVTLSEAQTMDKAEFSKAMDVYSFEPSIYEVWNDLHDFYYGAVVYGAYLNAATAEQSARMTAMDNASKNATEMLDKLSLIYNRARQAKITTELCEIISGAAAV